MTIEERKEREKEEMRRLILQAAGEIISSEGMDKLSIRKIAGRIDYSPAIIYHYFNDKDDILHNLMRQGYQKIVGGLSSAGVKGGTPEERFKAMARSYIDISLQMADEYKTVQLNDSPAILEYTSSMFEGASDQKPALKILVQSLKEIYGDKLQDDGQIELTAQIIAASSLGLIIKLILERQLVSDEHKNKLIERFVDFLMDAVKND